MLIYVHAKDMVDAGRAYPRHNGLDVRHTIIPGGLSAGHWVAQILGLLTDEERTAAPTIDMLIFNSLGVPGTLYIGEGIDEHNISMIAEPLRDLLRPLHAGGEGIEVHCDQVAAAFMFESRYTSGSYAVPSAEELNDATVRFIFAMARDFGTRVRASFDLQMPDRFGFFEGSFVEALPDENADWHGNIRQLTSSQTQMEDDVDSFRWPAAFGLR